MRIIQVSFVNICMVKKIRQNKFETNVENAGRVKKLTMDLKIRHFPHEKDKRTQLNFPE